MRIQEDTAKENRETVQYESRAAIVVVRKFVVTGFAVIKEDKEAVQSRFWAGLWLSTNIVSVKASKIIDPPNAEMILRMPILLCRITWE